MASTRSFVLDKKLFNPSLYSSLVQFWFNGVAPRASNISPEVVSRWFGVGTDAAFKSRFDADCRSAYGEALASIGPERFPLPQFVDIDTDRTNYPDIVCSFVDQLENAENVEEESSTNAALGLTLLLDQIPRNIFRNNQSLIYNHYDRVSRAVGSEIRARKLDRAERFANYPPWRVWFYLPLEHSESSKDHDIMQQMLVDMQARAEQRHDTDAMEYIKTQVDYETRHANIINKFGRYPHRNKALNREATPEEREWLEGGGETFGTG